MSWLGKILAFLVLIGSVVTAAMIANVYATRTNWKARADGLEKAFAESESNRRAELSRALAREAALAGQLRTEQDRSRDGEKALADARRNLEDKDRDYKAELAKLADKITESQKESAKVVVQLGEVEDLRKRNDELETLRTRLVIQKEQADKDRLQAQNEAALARAIADDNAKKVERLTIQVNELKLSGGADGAVRRAVERVPPPVPEGVRGTLTRDLSGDFVQLNIGLDAGLQAGARLDVYRETNGGQYLGTVVVSGSQLYPKQAVAEFRPARNVPVSQLRPDELPRRGDLVGVIAPRR